MKIRRILAYKVNYPLLETMTLSDDRHYDLLDGTVVRIETDSGVVGHGEVCPLGGSYLPAYPSGARTGIGELAPDLIGEDPTQLGRLNRRMDAALRGHPYVKSAIDIACWDILGQVTDQPVCNLLGGRYGDDFPLYRSISKDTPEKMAKVVANYQAEGFRHFQIKVGGDPDDDIERIHATAEILVPGGKLIADANTAWLTHQALRVVRAVRDVDLYIEQPCPTYEECLSVRRRTDHPFILDEVMVDTPILLRAYGDRAMDGINLKITKFGGLSRARLIRDLCVTLGIAMSVEDTSGGDIITAAIAHLAHSTPPEFMFMASDVNRRVEVSIAEGAPKRENARMSASTSPGLGVSPRMEVLGEPVIDVR
jgi:L-alanine-DL-glutamate epimerase-like enolase superfamily enzyme